MLSPRQIEQRVRELLDEHGVSRPPIRVDRLARALGATIREEPFDGDVSGALYRTGRKTVIGVNASNAEVRQRFTIAHEIGHLLLHEDTEVFVDRQFLGVVPTRGASTEPTFYRNAVSSHAVDPREIEANRFAAALLMPEHILEQDVKGKSLPLKADDLTALAGRYNVSQQAMVFRLMNLGIPVETA